MVVIGIVLVFKLLRLSILGVESRGANSRLELVVDLRGTMLARRLMMIESAVRPGAWLRGRRLRRGWLTWLTVDRHAAKLGNATTLPRLVIGLRIDLANVLQVLLELQLRLIESLGEGVGLLLQVVEAVGPLRRRRGAA